MSLLLIVCLAGSFGLSKSIRLCLLCEARVSHPSFVRLSCCPEFWALCFVIAMLPWELGINTPSLGVQALDSCTIMLILCKNLCRISW